MSALLEERTADLERRTDRLEILFDRFMEQTTAILKEMKEEAARDRAEAARARAEDRAEAARAREKDRAEAAEARKKDRAEAARERKEDRAEAAEARGKDRKEWNRRWGELANRMGTVVEDVIAPSIRRMAREELGCGDESLFCPRISVVRSDDRHYRREFDALYVGTGAVLLNETKTTARSEDARAFVGFLERNEFALYFPEYRDLPIVPVFSSLSLTENLVRYLTRNGVYAVAMGNEAMQVLNLKSVRERRQNREQAG